MFQYNILHNTLYINKFGKVNFARCSFCKLHDETIMHLFYDCLIVKRIWNQLSALFGFWDLDTDELLILNHLLLIFKMYIYNARTTGYLNVSHLLIYIKDIKDTEKKLSENDAKRRKKINKKWKNVLIN